MGTESIVTLIIVGLLVLVGSAFVAHTVEQNRREKKRLEVSLNKRLASFQHMLDNFPANFLGSDLKVLICKSMINVYEQLSRIGSSNSQYDNQMTRINQRLQEIANQPREQSYQPLENAAQINEIKGQLGMLHNFIGQLSGQSAISKEQADAYTKQLQVLLSQTAIDNYVIAARQAESQEKHRLAIHYYQSALDKVKKENLGNEYHEHAMSYQHRIEELRASNVDTTEHEELDQSDISKSGQDQEWDKFMDTDDDPWKKKSVYD